VSSLGFATTAYAATGEFGNQCSWGLANHKHVQTDCSISSQYGGRTYCFGSQEAQTNFMKSPSENLAKAPSISSNIEAKPRGAGTNLVRQ
jgi:YHS domain-containing protein